MAIEPPKKMRRERRPGSWHCTYDDFVGHPKWRLVSARTGVHLGFVHTIVEAMFQAASKARADGYLGGFDFEECAAQTDIPAEQIAAVYRVLEDIGWIVRGVVISWEAHNPSDKTATDRQRNKRAKDEARRAVAAGTATADQIELLSVEERAALAALAQMSRVTSTPPAPPPVERIAPFVLLQPRDGTYPAAEYARTENERAARIWLLGDASNRGADYGPASKIVADNFGCNRLNADTTIRRWLRDQMAGDVVALATIISGAEQQSLNGEGFRNVVEQRMKAFEDERTAGPRLPLGVGAIKGGRGT